MPEILYPLVINLIIWIFIFTVFKLFRPQNIFLGVSFTIMVFSALLTIALLLLEYNLDEVLYGLLLIFLGLIAILPLIIIFMLIFNGVKIIRNEGFPLRNSLSLLSGIALLFYAVSWPIIFTIRPNSEIVFIYFFLTFGLIYFAIVVYLYDLSNLLNLIHFPKKYIDYYIVLGSGLINNKVPNLLAGRIERALDLQAKTGYGKIIMSGGQGSDEAISESEAMIDFAKEKEIDPNILLSENQSTNTEENIVFSKEIIVNDWTFAKKPRVAIVTSNYHVLRALLLTRIEDMDAIGYGSKTKFYFALNGFIRELAAFLKMNWKSHIAFIMVIATILLLIYFR